MNTKPLPSPELPDLDKLVDEYSTVWSAEFIKDNPFNSMPEFGKAERKWIACGLRAVLDKFSDVSRRAQPEGEAPQAEVRDCPDCEGTGRISPVELCKRCDCSGVLPRWDRDSKAAQRPVPAAQQAESGAQVMGSPVDAVNASLCYIATPTAALAAQPQGAQAAELCIGFANNDQGVHVNVMQRHGDGTTIVLHQGRVPAGDSFARFTLAAKAEAPAAGEVIDQCMAAMNRHYPLPVTAHTSVAMRAMEDRDAFRKGWVERGRAQQAAAPGALDADDRAKWTTKQWYEHVGAWETPEGHISFGSVMALGAMLIQFQRAHRLAAPSAPGTPEAPAGRPLAEVPGSELQLELHLRRGPNYQCQHQSCRSMEDGPAKFDTCPACGRKGFLGGGFVKNRDSAEWKAWEQRTVSHYRAAQLDGGQGEGA